MAKSTIGSASDKPMTGTLQERFLKILPRIETHLRIRLRCRCADRHADLVAEGVALCWRWFLRLAEQGRDPVAYNSTLADFAVRHVRSGRRLCGQERSKDAMSPLAQQRRGFAVQTLPDFDTGTPGNEAIDALRDNHVTPPPDAAAFRIDFPAWLLTHTDRNRRIALAMMRGHSTGELAGTFGVSPGRVSQLRSEFYRDWARFHGEQIAA